MSRSPHERTAAAPLLWAALCALPTAAVARWSLPAGALLAALGLLMALAGRHRARYAGLCALPALLAAIESPAPAPSWPRPGPVRIEGLVTDVTRDPHTGTTFVQLGRARGAARILFDEDLDVLPGDRLRACGRLSAPAAPDLPPSLHGVAATADITPGAWSLARVAAAARRALERRLLELVPGEHGALLASLVLGRGTLPAGDVTAAHRATGLSHLLAVSGAHAAMLALLLGLRGRGHHLAASRARTIGVLGLLFAYAAITGNEPPVLRAVVTFVLAAIATRLGRPLGLAPGLAAPALVTCMLQPDALLGPSFLLSYAAVLGLSIAGPARGDSRVRRWLLGSLWSSWWATLLTAPLTLSFFAQLAPWTVLLTPLLAPLVAVLLLGGLLLAIAGCVAPSLAALAAPPLGATTAAYVAIVEAADHLPATPIHALVVPAPWLLTLAATAALFVVERWRHRRGVVFAVAITIAPHFLPLHRTTPPSLRLFAVGHGQAALAITADGRQTLVDCGSLQHPALATRRVAAALERRRIDVLVVTHADQDHHDGIPALAQLVPIACAILPRTLADTALARQLARSGTVLQFLGPGERADPTPYVHVASPDVPSGTSDNDASAWVQVELDGTTVLLTGDAEAFGTTTAIAQGLAPPSDVLVLPHHGRANAAAPALLRHVRPRVALASADAEDGLTALGPLARACGADVWATGLHGTIDLIGGSAPRVSGSVGARPVLPPR